MAASQAHGKLSVPTRAKWNQKRTISKPSLVLQDHSTVHLAVQELVAYRAHQLEPRRVLHGPHCNIVSSLEWATIA